MRKFKKARSVREDSDYDDEYIVKPEDTLKQIETAKELINEGRVEPLIWNKKGKRICR